MRDNFIGGINIYKMFSYSLYNIIRRMIYISHE